MSGSRLDKESLRILRTALDRLDAGFGALPPLDASQDEAPAMELVLLEVAERLHDNYPYFHPLYAGQMLKPPHPVARLAYALAQWINPNNHALDGGRASSAMEKEAVGDLARMFGWDAHLGHLCGGGTMANLEALWVAGRLQPGKVIVASEQAHYTHQRIGAVLGITVETIATDRRGRMDVNALQHRLESGDVGTVVATLGTTAIGSVDPLDEILALRERFDFRVHADTAYGGYFTLAGNLGAAARQAYDQLREVDSIVIDPHKHGLQPYGCGCVLFRDPGVGELYHHESPYTYFTSADLHLGEISLECSRPGAAAVGLWATQRLLPLVPRGDFARRLEQGRDAAIALHARLHDDARFVTAFAPELDIVIWAVRAATVTAASDRARAVFTVAASRDLHLALTDLPIAFFDLEAAGIRSDRQRITCLRSVLMKPEHEAWLDRIWERLDRATQEVLGASEPHS